MAYRIAPLSVTFSDLAGRFCCLKRHIPRVMQRVLSVICLHMNQKVHLACSFNYLFECEGLLKVTASHVHCKYGNISEIVAVGVVFYYKPLTGSDILPMK